MTHVSLLLLFLYAATPGATNGRAARATRNTDTLHIQGYYDTSPYRYRPSPKHWYLELKFGPYKPDVDSEPGLTGKPYEDIFGCGLDPASCSTWSGWQLLSQVELDFQFWQGHGSLGVGATLGFFRITGKALQPQDPTQPYDPASNPYVASGDETALNILPLTLQLVYRWDYAALHWGIPLVPYVKAGLVYAFWWIEDADGITSFPQGHDAYGGTFGYQVNVGLAVMLDPLEPGVAKNLDAETGINHTYLFVELLHSGIRWATGNRMRLGVPASFSAGLALEF